MTGRRNRKCCLIPTSPSQNESHGSQTEFVEKSSSAGPLWQKSRLFPMSDAASFTDFIQRIRAGDDQAAEELVRRYEPLIRREVRLRIEDERLNRAFDSMDVCQSVLASFFVRAATGQYDLDEPQNLVQLLVTMARNKLASKARLEHRQRRDSRRVTGVSSEVMAELSDGQPSPSEILSRRELLERLRASLTDEERAIADLRGQGLDWEQVAERLGGSGNTRRMQLTRGIERVGRELGLEEGS
jgi:RNA polymerase sigma factor (sigma-70 family)